MLVKEVIQAIESKELSIKQLAEQYNVSDRTIQNKIKRLGFKWMPKEAKYQFEGEDESQLDAEFSSLFVSPQKASGEPVAKRNTSTPKVKRKLTEANTELHRDTNNNSSEDSSETTSSNESQNESENDIIDILLSGKQKNNKRVYRGFYFDSDVLNIIDSAHSGNKSELVNQALRKVFKDKGLL